MFFVVERALVRALSFPRVQVFRTPAQPFFFVFISFYFNVGLSSDGIALALSASYPERSCSSLVQVSD